MTDAIDLGAAILTPNTVADRAVTTAITRLDLLPSGFHVEFDKKDGADRWPDVPFGKPGDSLQYCLWIGARLSDGWHVAACYNAWHGLDPIGGTGAEPAQYPGNLWYLDGALGQHTPMVDELLAFFVTAGGDRGINEHLVRERSNVVTVRMPGPAGASYLLGNAGVAAGAGPSPAPTPLPAPPPGEDIADLLGELLHDGDRIASALEAIVDTFHTIDQRLAALEQNGVRVRL